MKKTLRLSRLPFVLFCATAFAFSAAAADSLVSNSDEQTAVFQNGLNAYNAAVDVGIDSQNPSKSQPRGNNTWVLREAKKTNEGVETLVREKQTLLRFPNIFGDAPGQIPDGASIARATLTLNTGKLKDATSFHRIFLHRLLVSWESKKASWDARYWHGDGIQPDGKEAIAQPDAFFVPNRPSTSYDIDVTASLRAWAAGQKNRGWVFLDTRFNPKAAAFISSRAPKTEQRPKLSVTWDSNPSNAAPSASNLSANLSGDTATLSLLANDPNPADSLNVTFFGRPQTAAAPSFTIALIPDTQYYTMKKFGGTPEMFFAQTRWIAQNAKRLNIAFALHLGDITDTGDVFENAEWDIADAAMKILEDPKVSGLPHGVPYDICVGNHDQRFLAPDGKHKYNGPALYFDKYFGIKRFQGRPYYGGHYGDNNKNHYTLFDAGSAKFIVVSLDYRAPAKNPAVLEWAAGLLDQHADRQAIILTHDSLLPGVPGSFGTDGAAVFNALKTKPNLLLIVGGHTTGEGWRTDTREDLPPVHSLVQDFQLDENGGDGWLRLLTFSPAENKILATTYSPFLDRWRDDPAGKFSIPHDFGTKIAPFEKIASVKTSPGKTVSVPWKTPAPAREWFAEISDGRKTIRTAPQLIPAP